MGSSPQHFKGIFRFHNMKRLRIHTLLALLLLCMAALTPRAYAKGGDAKIHFDETSFDFGQVSVKKGHVSHEFTFTNQGEGNLVILDAKADCGCTRPAYGEAPVAPGKQGTVKVTFVPNGRGFFSKKVTVITNGSPRKARLVIKGEVIP